eukprot:TRINITY_DN10990_c0_g1_i1.p1 TRINITY_DN10990_c0_g1~~TRINITY_DN10990_c0_g1_i1.p1  ORF type:complete len:439 (-),score=72.72 TRINITY_DN10990_c0_g1_i1:104-1420(-)
MAGWKQKNDSWKESSTWKETTASSDGNNSWNGQAANVAAVPAKPVVVAPRQLFVPWPKAKTDAGDSNQVGQLGQSGNRFPVVMARKGSVTMQKLDNVKLNKTVTALPVTTAQYTVYIDELDMPERPMVEPSPTDREVWVDPLPDDDDLTDWLRSFGEVDQVFRVPDPETHEPADRGYVQFKHHETAKGCVETGAGKWSESERALASQTSYQRFTIRCYPESIVSAFLGKRGEDVAKLRKACGVWKLAVKGADLAPKTGIDDCGDDNGSERLHFWAEGPEGTIDRVRPALENRLSEIHIELKQTLAELGESWQNEQKEMFKKLMDYKRSLDDGDGNASGSKRRKLNESSHFDADSEEDEDDQGQHCTSDAWREAEAEVEHESEAEAAEAPEPEVDAYAEYGMDWFRMPARNRSVYGGGAGRYRGYGRSRTDRPPSDVDR